MDNKYELFLSNAVVINIRNEKEFKDFIQLMENLGLSKISYMKRIYDKYGFDNGFCYNAGIRYCNPEDVCFEYQIGKGFTFSSINEYSKSDYFEVCSLEDIMIDTGYCIKIDDIVINKPLSVENEESVSNQYSQFVMMVRPEEKTSLVNYQPIEGFYDLREFEIPEDKFMELWKMQKYLKSFDEEKITIKSIAPEFWKHLKELSGSYQQQLLSYPKKELISENNNYKELAKKYSLFIEHYEKYLKENQSDVEKESVENKDALFLAIYNTFKEQTDKRFYPWRFLCGDNIEESLCEIFKSDVGKTFRLLGALDGVTENYFPFAVDELEDYYKKENIDFDGDKVIDMLDSFKVKEDLDPKIFSKETINMFELYNEANTLESELYKHYESMKKTKDLDIEIEK